ncbi:MAG: UDP-4-amino-4,6-dideoxy-N-acetyl-beta-L-altrosamine transaminase [Candidatus Omnitrophica bacterium CG11_big_fil_rev_8_21_14_0_20_45_26]|uniref:UDP-4-amino-4, 6-dideoxy-N-acetyl-beta-L-altrosamine transaminase n=1 Tax=Candidatus Abzuiibacterium crystallinum TaxID=1974748 RepID=A0A2H0LLE2_9BACT|nr:MAG: UDP-4-amino-4,6-dideoxy-N-acetyl-beta-L-altrosamine transaminase [Candidatus Omnitrophica bacterium CG11_big_fil_rev_8_21_14_0_20_45_26]PIW65397.1 MAG: UDP-4-amino-4,6-dideoxy-N-acetyl-beta-L-altrosamine transaminase [Candidatus Omnitrophica bacterium CG12_big_fil_rev_8_21_14_0_65_45_16]
MKNQSQLSPKPSNELTSSSSFIPYSRQEIDEEDIRAVTDVLRSPYITQGEYVARFEEALAEYTQTPFAVVFSSGTAALHAACLAAGVQAGDEVITSALTFVASANCAVYSGATPILSDIDPAHLCLDPSQLEKKITKKTKVIIPVDFAGRAAPLEEIRKIAKAHHLAVIEDACHALGATYRHQKIGSFSDMTVFSFHPVKSITTGEGGAITTSDPAYYERLKQIRHHGIVKNYEDLLSKQDAENAFYYEVQSLGYNYRITDFQCALGLSQLKKLDRFIAARNQLAERYHHALKEIPEVVPAPLPEPDTRHAYHLYPIQIKSQNSKVNRDSICRHFFEAGIRVQVHYVPLHLHPFYQQQFGYQKGQFPHAETYYQNALSLPIFPGLTEAQQTHVIQSLKAFINANR